MATNYDFVDEELPRLAVPSSWRRETVASSVAIQTLAPSFVESSSQTAVSKTTEVGVHIVGHAVCPSVDERLVRGCRCVLECRSNALPHHASHACWGGASSVECATRAVILQVNVRVRGRA
jgi:hypothetical protein